MKLLFSFFVVCCSSMLVFNHSASADITFEFIDTAPDLADGLDDGDTVTANGITITFSNVIVSNGTTTGDVEAAGILMSSSTDPGLTDVVGFDFSFDTDIFIDSYTIGIREDIPAGRFFTVAGGGGTSGNNAVPAGSSFVDENFVFDSGTIGLFEAGEVYTFSQNLPSTGDPLFNFKSFTVSTIPEPGSAWLVSLGLFAGWIRRRRNR